VKIFIYYGLLFIIGLSLAFLAVINFNTSHFIWSVVAIIILVVAGILMLQYKKHEVREIGKIKALDTILSQGMTSPEAMNFYEKISYGFVAFDNNWRCVYINDKAAKLLNRDAKSLLGKIMMEEFPEASGNFYTVCQHAKLTQQYQYVQEYYSSQDVWLEHHIYPSPQGLSIYFRNITNKIKSESERKRLAQIIESSSDFVGIVDKDQKMIYMNQSGIEALGFSGLEEVIATPMPEFLPERFREAFQNEMIPFIKKFGGWNGETYWKTRIGKEIPVSVVVQEHKNEKGQVEYYSSVARDISERKKIEKELRQAEETQRLIMHSTLDAIVGMDAEGRIIIWTPNAEKTFGWKENEVLGKTVAETIVPPAYREQHKQEVAHYLKTDENKVINRLTEIVALNREGKEFPVELTIVPVRQKDSMFFCAFIRDITSRKKAEKEILEANEKIIKEKNLSDTLINSLPGLFYVFDKDGNFLRWNKAFEDFSGYNAKEIMQMHPLDFIEDADKQLMEQRISQVFENGSANLEASFITKKGERIPFYFTALLHNYDGKPSCLGFGIDLLEIKRLEKELADERVAVQQKVMQAMLKAQETEKSTIGRELHDNVNQVLAVVKMYLDTLERNEGGTLITIASARDLLQSAMNEIRNLSHNLAANYEFDKGIEEALQHLVERILRTNKLIIDLYCEESVDMLAGSDMKLTVYRIVQEQLTNIIKHADATEVIIKLLYRDSQVILHIQDNGKGFEIGKVKEGIGLNNIRLRAETLNGKVSIQSSPGRGSSLEISLPVSYQVIA